MEIQNIINEQAYPLAILILVSICLLLYYLIRRPTSKSSMGSAGDFSFIEFPNMVRIQVSFDEMTEQGYDSLEKKADIIWSYTEMKTELIKRDEPSSSKDLIDQVFNEHSDTRYVISDNTSENEMEDYPEFDHDSIPEFEENNDDEVDLDEVSKQQK